MPELPRPRSGPRLGPWLEPGLGPALIFALALALRLTYVTHQEAFRLGDEPSLFTYALNVARGQYYGTSGAYWPPGFIVLAGWILRLFGPDPDWRALTVVQAVLGSATAVLLYLWLRRQQGAAAAWAGGLLLALHPALIFYTGRFLSETLFLFLLLACLLALDAHFRSDSPRTLTVAGVLLGLSALTRPVSLPLLFLAPIWWWLTGRHRLPAALGRGALLAAVALALILPWTVRNYLVSGTPTLIDVNGGINFYLAHNPRATGMWVDMGAADPVLKGFDRPETEHRAWQAGLQYALTHPGRELELVRAKFEYFWRTADWDVQEHGGPLFAVLQRWHLPVLTLETLKLLGVAGLLVAIARRRPVLLPLLFIAYYNALLLAFYFAPRYRLVAEPFLAYFAAVALGAAAEAAGRGVADTPADTEG